MGFDSIFGIHEHALKVHAQRAQVLAANLANADTPGYKARDFDFKQVLASQSAGQGVQMRATHARHVSSSQGVVSSAQMQYRNPQQASLDGNTVEVEREQVEHAANALRYQASLRFLEGKIKSIKTALTGSAS